MIKRTLILLALLGLPCLVSAQGRRTSPVPARRSPVSGHLQITMALVDSDLAVRPIPQAEVALHRTDDTVLTMVHTSLQGRIEIDLPVGSYAISTPRPIRVGGVRYVWSVAVDVVAEHLNELELTNLNAQVDSSGAFSSGQREMAPEVAAYRRYRAGVFRVMAGLSHGSGFLVSRDGLVLTNAHVVAGEVEATIMLDSLRRVPADILLRDSERDVAVLRINPSLTESLPVLPLSASSAEQTPVSAGERVLAIGFPLHQEQTLTSGIISSVRNGAVISDVNINHGNSGGPMLTLDGRVIAINAFGDLPTNGGPGLSGSIAIERAFPVIDSARKVAVARSAPDTIQLPILPREPIAIDVVRYAADHANEQEYRKFDGMSLRGVQMDLSTPVATLLRRRAYDEEIAHDRHRREKQANLPAEQRYNEVLTDYEWMQYVGDDRAPVISLSISPKLAETGGSVFRRLMLTGAYGQRTMRFQGDLQSVLVFRNGLPVSPILAGRSPVQAFENNVWVDVRDVAFGGYVVLSPQTFRPDSAGVPPSIVIALNDLKNPRGFYCGELPRAVVAAAWNEFIPWIESTHPPMHPPLSDPHLKSPLSGHLPGACRDSNAP